MLLYRKMAFLLCLSSAATAQNNAMPTRALSELNWEDFQKTPEEISDLENPFIEHTEATEAPDLNLFAVAVNSKKAYALIGKQVVQKGDHIGTYEVFNIKPNQVLLKGPYGLVKLSFASTRSDTSTSILTNNQETK